MVPRTSQAHLAQFVLGKKVSIMWLRCGHFDNRPGASFEPNHVVAMKQCSPVDSQQEHIVSGRSAVAGHSETKTRGRIDSFRFFIPPPITVKEETSDGLTATTEKISTTRQQLETIIEARLTDHRRSRKN